MRILSVVILVGVFAVALLLLFLFRSRENDTAHQSGDTPSDSNTLEAKLALLAERGLALSPNFTADDLLESWDREAFEQPGFDLTLFTLGMTEERPPWRPHCQSLWHFDTECIEGDGSYVEIAERMAAMAGPSLPLENISDYVDLDSREAWLQFTCQGQEYKIICEVEDDWVDPKIFSHFVELLEKTDPDKVYIYYDLGGQDCILGCLSRQQFKELQKLIPTLQPLS